MVFTDRMPEDDLYGSIQKVPPRTISNYGISFYGPVPLSGPKNPLQVHVVLGGPGLLQDYLPPEASLRLRDFGIDDADRCGPSNTKRRGHLSHQMTCPGPEVLTLKRPAQRSFGAFHGFSFGIEPGECTTSKVERSVFRPPKELGPLKKTEALHASFQGAVSIQPQFLGKSHSHPHQLAEWIQTPPGPIQVVVAQGLYIYIIIMYYVCICMFDPMKTLGSCSKIYIHIG